MTEPKAFQGTPSTPSPITYALALYDAEREAVEAFFVANDTPVSGGVVGRDQDEYRGLRSLVNVAMVDGEIVGAAYSLVPESDALHLSYEANRPDAAQELVTLTQALEQITVREDHRGCGIGAGLIARQASRLRGGGIRSLIGLVPEPTVAFYLSLGFRVHDAGDRQLITLPQAGLTVVLDASEGHRHVRLAL